MALVGLTLIAGAAIAAAPSVAESAASNQVIHLNHLSVGAVLAIAGGVSFKGSATITNGGDFVIPLNGAFFGPRAAEVGGVYQVLRAGAVYGAGAFGGTIVP